MTPYIHRFQNSRFRNSVVLTLTTLALLSTDVFSQINGRCVFVPAVKRATINIHVVDGKDTIRTESTDALLYRYAIAGIPANLRPYLVAELETVYFAGDTKNHAAEFVQINTNRKWSNNPHDIKLKRKVDVYGAMQQRATTSLVAGRLAEAKASLQFLSANREQLSLNENQLFETYVNLGLVAQQEKDFDLQLAYLDSLKMEANLDELSQGQRKRYSREVFNAFLSKNSFNSLRTPVDDVSSKIVNDSATFNEWKDILQIVNDSDITISNDKDTVKKQVEKLLKQLNEN